MNYLKMYNEVIENTPDYQEDFIYSLFEMFVYDYVPQIIEQHLKKRKMDIKVPLRDIGQYFVSKGLREADIDLAKVMDYARTGLSCYVKEGHFEGNLRLLIISYYDFLHTEDYNLKGEVIRNVTSDYTYDVFENVILKGMLPAIITLYESKGQDSIVIDFSLTDDGAIFNTVTFRNINKEEFSEYILNIPNKSVAHSGNDYKITYNLRDVKRYCYGELQKLEYQQNLSR